MRVENFYVYEKSSWVNFPGDYYDYDYARHLKILFTLRQGVGTEPFFLILLNLGK